MPVTNRRYRINIFDKTAEGDFDTLIKYLQSQKKKLAEIGDFMHQEGYKVRDDIISGIPRYTGNLSNSVHVYYAPSTRRMTIKVNAPYAKAVEYGSGPRGVGTYPGDDAPAYTDTGWWFGTSLSKAMELHDRYGMKYRVQKDDPSSAMVYTVGQRAKAFVYHAKQNAFGPGGYFWDDAMRWLNDGGNT